nr:TIGR03915 family putative DNA repair protein [Bacilli bacterium]
MNDYLYDGTYSSLLGLIYTLIKSKTIPNVIKREDEYISNLFMEPIYLKLENKELINSLKKEVSMLVLYTAYYIYLSNVNNKEMIIYGFIKNAIKYKNTVFYRRDIYVVSEAIRISNQVKGEAHRMKGFLRFKKMKNFYYATIEPTHNIIWIITRHFKDRLKDECWIIKDSKRGVYAIYDLKKVTYLQENDIIKLNLDLSDDETLFEDLWKTFFKTVAIKERENLKCQMNHAPKKYWNNMLEMEDL